MTKIIITGGHHNSALVVARDLKSRGVEILWFGHKQASHGDQNHSAEYLEVKAAGIDFYDLRAGKIGKYPRLSSLVKIPLGISSSISQLRIIKPDAVLSFGSYLGFATAVAALALGIPVYIHEQTVVAGRANQLVSRFAKRVFLTWPSSQNNFPQSKTMLVGLPIRESVLASPISPLFDNPLPTILVMGGKQGSHIINTQVFALLSVLLPKYNLIHQTGTSSVTADYQTALTHRESLSKELKARYRPVGYIGEEEIGRVLRSCDLYIGRSGAHTCYELALLGKKSLLIPFIHTHLQEQLRMAERLRTAGLAVILPQADLSSSSLMRSLPQAFGLVASPLTLKTDASAKITETILHDLGA